MPSTISARLGRKLTGSHLLPLVRAGTKFVDGVQVERKEDEEEREKAA
jgi:hypothetical protein